MSDQTVSKEIIIVPGIYQHFKGNLYHVLGVCLDGENPKDTTQSVVVYVPLYIPKEGPKPGLRKRTPQGFSEHVDRDELNYHGPRFKLVLELPERLWLPLVGEKFSYVNTARLETISYTLNANGSVIISSTLQLGGGCSFCLDKVFKEIRPYADNFIGCV